MTSGRLGECLKGDSVAEAFDLGNEPLDLSFGISFAKVVAAEVAVQLAGAEHVPDRADDRVFDGAERAGVSDPGSESPGIGLGGSCRWF